MGRLKQLLPFADRPAVGCCLDAIGAAGVSEIVAVLGPGAAEISAVIGPQARVVINSQPESQMADSVRVGLEALGPAAEAVLICLADHPLVSSDTISMILARGADRPGSIIVPSHKGRRGHPSLFPRAILRGVFAGHTLRDIIHDNETSLDILDVADEGVVLDMDTEDDYRRMTEIYGR